MDETFRVIRFHISGEVVDPVQGDLGLLVCARAGSGDVIAAEALNLVDVRGVLAAGLQRVRRAWPELRSVLQHEG